MNLPAPLRSNITRLVLGFVLLSLPRFSHAAGVTIITHGLYSNVDDWVISMAGRMTDYPLFPGHNSTCYELYFVPAVGGGYTMAWQRLSGLAPTTTDSGEIFIKLDWRQLANDNYNTYKVAGAAASRLLQTNFISELGGHALSELPIHLIGHSRGGSVMSEMCRILGTNGVWVDQLTTLDPHPLNQDGFNDFPLTEVDAPVRTYENVLFHDNYFQTLNVFAHGESVDGAFVRQLTDLSGGYDTFTAAHSDVHLWYHGTIDLRSVADDSVASITGTERNNWWTSAENLGAKAGYHYSRMGRGDRLSLDRPAGSGTSRIRDGYNQRWELGAGQNDNRTSLPRNNGRWPSLIKFNLTGTNRMTQGESNAVTLFYQWAQPETSSATLSVFLDDDFNPFNGNEQLVLQGHVPGTGATVVRNGTLSVNVATTNTTTGFHTVYARLSGGGQTRYLYAPETLEVLPGVGPPPPAPGIITQPAGKILALGSNTTLSVTAAGGSPLRYQWYKDELALDAATNALLSFSNVSSNDAGGYFVVVSNAGGSVTSSVASLVVVYPATISVAPTNLVRLVGQTLSLTPTITGAGPFSYRWFLNGRVIAKQISSQLTIPNLALRARGLYQVEVRNLAGVVQSEAINVNVVTPPTILRSPRSLRVRNGKAATFRVAVKGSNPLTFQWLKDGAEIENATNRMFTIKPVTSTDAGAYSVRVSNAGAVRESNAATLTVLP